MDDITLCLGCMEKKEHDGPCERCGYSNDAPYLPAYLAPGTVLDERYIVGKLLRYNGESAVYIAYDAVIDRKIWIKEYMPDSLCSRVKNSTMITVNQNNLAPYKTFMSEFTELNKTLSKMRTLNHINPALDIFCENNTTYVTFDAIRGVTLKEYLQDNAGELSWEDVKKMFPPIFTTFSLIHNAGIVHRGISPETIWITDNGGLKISGFSVTAARTANTELAPELYAGYAAPEQYSSSNWQGTWTDVYAICALLYRILTGCMPTEAVSRIGNDNLCEPSSINPNIPANVSKVIMHGLTLSGDMRIQTVTELVTKLFEQPDYLDEIGRSHTGTIPRQLDFGTNRPNQRPSAPRKKKKKKKKSNINQIRIPVIVFVVTISILLILSSVILNVLEGEEAAETTVTTAYTTVETTPVETTTITVPPSVEPTYLVPNFVDKNFELIQNSKTYKDWLIFIPTYEYNDDYAKDTIFEQSIDEGEFVSAGISITLKVSLGPSKVAVPDYFGKQEKEYLALLDSAGIKYEIERKVDTGYMSGIVIQTSKNVDELIDVEAGEILIVYVCDNDNTGVDTTPLI